MARLSGWRTRGGVEGITVVRSERSPYNRMVTVQLTKEEEELLREHFLAEFGLMAIEQNGTS